MLNKIVTKIFKPKHPWRHMKFDELSEIYVSMLFRGIAISMTGLFVPIYMLNLGYSIGSIIFVVAIFFTARFLLFDILSAYTVARFGPKHSMLIGYILLGINTALFLAINTISIPLWIIGAIWGGSASFFFIPFHVDFSKIKHSKNGGKELSYVHLMEKTGAVIGPLIGGIIATIFGPQYLFLIATILIIIGLIPLFMTSEPVKTRQHISFYGLPIKRLKRDYYSIAALGVENTISMFLWPLFIGIFVFVDKTVYAKMGAITTISIIASIFAVYTIGKTIDNRKGRALLRANAIANAALNLVKPFVFSFSPALIVAVLNDVITPGYRVPYQKGFYDAADDLPGYRIAYITSMEWFSSVCKSLIWWLLFLMTPIFSDYTIITTGFVIAAIASILIMTEKFKALNPQR
jgi:MFS family permease